MYWLGVPAAIVAAVATVYAATDKLGIRPVLNRELNKLEIVIASNQSAIQLMQWQVLEQRRKTKGLSANDLVIYCKLSKALGLKGKGCR